MLSRILSTASVSALLCFSFCSILLSCIALNDSASDFSILPCQPVFSSLSFSSFSLISPSDFAVSARISR